VNTNVDLGLEIGGHSQTIDITLYPSLFDFQTELLSESTILAAMFFIIFNCLHFARLDKRLL
jgi:hypothetical protein